MDYYPFGWEMPGRKYNSSEYRYGFNGKEKDQSGEFGSITNYDYGFRIYNPAIGKFLSVDPLTKEYPWLTPYQFAENAPIKFIDLDGAEKENDKESFNIWEHLLKTFIVMSAEQGARESGIPNDSPEAMSHNTVIGVQTMLLVATDAVALHPSQQFLPSKRSNSKAPKPKIKNPKEGVLKRLLNRYNVPAQNKKGVNDINPKPNQVLTPSTMREVKGGSGLDPFKGREVIVDENISPKVTDALEASGFNVKTFPKGTLDPDIIDHAQKNNSIVLTNNIKDFVKQDITTIKVSERLKRSDNVGELVNRIKNIDKASTTDPSIIEKGKKVSAANDTFNK